MTEQPNDTDTGGIDQSLDAGPADSALADAENPQDARKTSTVRTDPDDPIAGIKEATEASEQPG